MKTIKEGLDEAYKKAGQNAYFENGFNAGIEFAQRWIPVEEELPEIKDKPYQVLVKSITGHMETYHVIDRKSQHFIKEFIKWRHIELK